MCLLILYTFVVMVGVWRILRGFSGSDPVRIGSVGRTGLSLEINDETGG